MEKICEYNQCSGCGACRGVCPKDCIKLLPDKKNSGHIYPVIDNAACINCGLCVKTCPVNNPVLLSTPGKTYAAYTLNDEICENSSSGGLAYTLGEAVIASGGTVYGCVVEYGQNFSIHHERCENNKTLRRTQGSKYVHSTINRCVYQQIRNDLIEGRNVLFVGTGCEVAGVRNYLKKDYPNFYAIDIICHGVPSVQIFKDYLSKKYDITEINKIFFRGKKGFDTYGNYGTYGTPFFMPLKNNLYMMGFMKGLYYRDACYSCPYARKERSGDITLGDFWGLKKNVSSADRKSSGISVVLVNSSKGEKLISQVRPGLCMEERPQEEAIAGNPQLRRPSRRHYASAFFRKTYPILGMKTAATFCLIREKLFYAYVLPLLNRIKS